MDSPSACVANIGPRQRARRVRVGIVAFLVGALVIISVVAMGVARPWRLLAFLPLWAGALGIFQAREKTCVALVAQGKRDMDAGPEVVSDPAELARLKKQALGVHVRSFLAASVLCAVAMAIP
jgi:hypothetical protein